MAAQNQKLMHY